jgi:hypothetical protein
MKNFFVWDIFCLLGHLARRNTLCRLGFHKKEYRTELLAFGEKLVQRICGVYGCDYRGESHLELPNDGKDGTLLEMDQVTGQVRNSRRVSLREIGVKRVDTKDIPKLAFPNYLKKTHVINK